MRNPERITPYCRRLEWLWREFPDMRLGQLISNALPPETDIFSVEDEDLMEALMKYIENN